MKQAKRIVSLLLAVMLCITTLGIAVFPASAKEDSGIPAIWSEAGLVPAEGESYLDLTQEDAIRDGVIFLAPDWSKYACNEAGEKLGRLPDINEQFYATMPTTGITYKLTYAVTAGNFNNTNASLFGTVVMFPGTYTGGTQYIGSGFDSRTDYVNGEFVYSTKTGSNAFGLAFNNSRSKITSSIPHIRLLGPYAGVQAGDTETGAYLRDGQYEANVSGTYIYPMNKAFLNGAATTIDGIEGTNKFAVVCRYANANYFVKQTNYLTVNINNCYVHDAGGRAVFQLYGVDGTVGQDNSKNIVKGSMRVNINGSFLRWEEDVTYGPGAFNCDAIHIKNTVYEKLNGADAKVSDSLRKGFRIAPATSANNPGTHKVSYTLENSFIHSPYGPVFNLYGAGTDALSTRGGIDVVIRNNKIVDSGIASARSTNSIFAYNDGSATDSASSGTITYTAATRKAHAEMMSMTVTGNRFYNNTGTEYSGTMGNTLYGPGTSYIMRKLDVSGNYFYGYDYDGAIYGAFHTSAEFGRNVYLSADGETVYALSPYRGTASEVMLFDMKHKASDFNITAVAGTANVTKAKWTKGVACAITQTATLPYAAGMDVEYMNAMLAFAGKNVTVTGVFSDEEREEPVTEFAPESTYYATLGYDDGNPFTAALTLTTGADTGAALPVATADGVPYATLAQALTAVKAGGTIRLMRDLSAEHIALDPAVTLDLNGHTLTADYFVGFATSTVFGGRLHAPRDKVALDNTNGGYLPVYDGEGYRFITVTMREEKRNETGETCFYFSPRLTEAHDELAEGATPAALSIVVRLSWTKAENYVAKQDFIYMDEMVKTVVESYGAQPEYPDYYTKAFYANFVGSEAQQAEDLRIHAAIVSETGTEIIGEGLDFFPEQESAPDEPVSLDGKKVIFIGNSFTYYGKCVLEKTQSKLTQAERIHDRGYFYQICKNNGMEVDVTNWTWGGHSLTDTFGGSCAADRGCDGVDHASYLTDRYYDYVVIQEGSGSDEAATLAIVENIMALFREANPAVKFVYIVHHRMHMKQTNMLALAPQFAEQGLIVVDWGELVSDLISGETVVEGSSFVYDQNTFIVSKSASDGYHENMLSGYITAMMTFCTLTGIKAEGQDYRFAYDTAVSSAFDAGSYKDTYYSYGNTTTHFSSVLSSEYDMRAIQRLMDEYIAAKDYLNYGK